MGKKLVALLLTARRILISEEENAIVKTIRPVGMPKNLSAGNISDESVILENAPAKANAYMKGFNTYYKLESQLNGEISSGTSAKITFYPIQYYKITRKKS